MMNSEGIIKYLLYGEGIAQASQSVTNITGTTTKTLTVPAVPGSGTEQYIALISGTGSFTGAFKATRASATTFTIVLNSDLGSTFSGMTVTLYYKIRTLHGTGALADKTDTTSIVYSPSLGENTETNSFALFDSAKNGFYCTLSGLTGYRVIGSIAGAATVSTLIPIAVFSFKSGRNKNDNFAKAHTVVSVLAGGTVRWANLEQAFGCDYIFVPNNATFGNAVILNRGGVASARFQYPSSAAANVQIDTTFTISNYSPGLGGTNFADGFTASAATNCNAVTAANVRLSKDSVIKVYGTNIALAIPSARFVFLLELN